ncbi:PREDICTED: uncharacterized protein LOC109335047 [Lupinus angustifolius]|uniref:uncharacterized protein LOC109335047 n=1 Tax=Lupinus angustifolius TaxID=3871 RepID=UPI00092E3F91|nr:PREDICTED: uncharacterized protein LOC109335047 [Lupinus angustifolius]
MVGGNGNNLPSMGLLILIEKNWDRWRTQMKVLFCFQEVSKVIEDDFLHLGPNAIETQRAIRKEAKKKDNKMQSLPRRFDFIVVVIEEVKIEELQSSLEAHELRLFDRNPVKKYEQALKTSHFREEDIRKYKKWKGKQGYHKRGHMNPTRSNHDWTESLDRGGRTRLNQKRFDKGKVECYNCHKLGHYSYECAKDKSNLIKNHEEAYATHEPDSEPLNLIVTTSAADSYIESWYLDSGCSKHKEWLIDFDSAKKSRVKFVCDNSLEVEGVGNVVIIRENGSTAIITNVLYVPKMKFNLLSIDQLIEKGFTVLMKNGQVELFDYENKLIFRSKVNKNRTFLVNIKVVEIHCLASMEISDENWL